MTSRVIYFRIFNYFAEYVINYFKKSREEKRRETKKGWREDHLKVEYVEKGFIEKIVSKNAFPRLRITFQVLIT